MLHLHAAVYQHVATEMSTNQAGCEGIRAEKTVQQVPGAESVELGPAEPEATAHLGTSLGLANLVDQVADGHRGTLQPDAAEISLDRGAARD